MAQGSDCRSSVGKGPRDILSFFPSHLTPRPEQIEILRGVERVWHSHDCLVLCCPTAVGKTELALTVARWAAAQGKSTNILEPTNLLVEQFDRRYPGLQLLHRQDAYHCADMNMSCPDRKDACEGFCKGCVYLGAKRATKAAPIRLMNFWTYWSHRMYANVAIFDEAHQLVEMLQDKKDLKLWQSTHKFPDGMRMVSDVVTWLQARLTTGEDERLRRVLRDVIRISDGATIEYKQAWHRGKNDVCLHVHPDSGKDIPPWLWPPGKVSKIVLMSATVGEQDVLDLALANRRVAYLQCGSPIPPEQRPFIYEPCTNMSYKLIDRALPVLAKKIETLLDKHPDKGLIHLPYAQAEALQTLIQHPRLMFHDRNNKIEMLKLFKESPPADGRVLVASGLYEGVDLPYDAARWQVIGKVPYASLASDLNKQRAEQHPQQYAWAAIKQILQAYGRIVRAADDFGVTYIFDVNFGALLSRWRRLFPGFVLQAIKERK